MYYISENFYQKCPIDKFFQIVYNKYRSYKYRHQSESKVNMRADGKIVKNVDPMYKLAPYFMRNRSDAQNMIKVSVPYEDIHKYVMETRKNGQKISHLAVVLAALVRTISEYNQLNRFVVNSKIYARNEIAFAMVVMRPGEANPSMSKMKFDLYDTIFDINDKINAFIEENNKVTSNNSSDELFAKILAMPAFMLRGMMALVRFLDKHGILPKAIIDASPFHNTLVFTNLASIRTNYIYHHVYDFGTTSMIIAMGNNIDTPKMDKEGNFHLQKEVPFGIVMDERIATGSYYAKAFTRINEYLKNPALLENPPENVNVDYPFEGLSEKFKSEKTKKKEAQKAEKAKKNK